VGYGLAYLYVYSGNFAEFCSKFPDDLFAASLVELVGSLDFRYVDTERMFVKFGSAGFACNGFYLGY